MLKITKQGLVSFYYKYLYDFIYSIWYSIKDLFKEIGVIASYLKKPNTWIFILVGVIVYSIATNNHRLLTIAFPSILIMYLLRQRVDGAYKKETRKKALIKDNDLLLKEFYTKYQRDCYFSKTEPLDYNLWKEEERKKL